MVIAGTMSLGLIEFQRVLANTTTNVYVPADSIPQSVDTLLVDSVASDIVPDLLLGDSIVLLEDSLAIDSLATDSLNVDSLEVEEPVYVAPPTPGLLASWSRCYPMQPVSAEARRAALADSANVSALRQQVDSVDVNPALRYAQVDFRMPIILSSQVPEQQSLAIAPVATESGMSDRLCSFDNLFQQQLAYGQQLNNAIFRYSMKHLNAVSIMRPENYDLPTERKLIERQELTGQEHVETGLALELEPSGLNIEQVTFHADKWHRRGTTDLQISQTALSDNWYKGGENNLTIANYDRVNFSRYDESMKTSLDITLELRLSGYLSKADTVHSMRVNDNQFRADVSYGYKAWKNWYYSTSAYLKTPIFEYFNANSREVKSTFFSPLEINVAIGMDLKQMKKKNYSYSLMFAPLSYNVKSVSDDRVSVTSFGIKANHRSLHQFGSSITGKLEWKMTDVVSWTSRAYFFTTYHSTLFEFENTFNLQLSRYSTAKVYLFPRFDDGVDNKWQMKEMLTFGLALHW